MLSRYSDYIIFFQRLATFLIFHTQAYESCVITGYDKYRHDPSLRLSTTIEQDYATCSLNCAKNERCLYWVYNSANQCGLIPSETLNMNEQVEQGSSTRRGLRYCHPLVCANVPFLNNTNNNWNGDFISTGDQVR